MRSRVILITLIMCFTALSATAFSQTPEKSTVSKTTTPTKTRAKLKTKPLPRAKAADTIQQTVYRCERETSVPVTYINTASGESFAVLNVEGKQVAMKNAVSASGARYISIDETQGYRWHTKGDTATLLHLEADHTAKETIVLRNCTK